MDRFSPTYSLLVFRRFAATAVPIVVVLLAMTVSADAETPSAKAALTLAPVHQDVEYERVSADAVADCRVQDIEHESWSGWEVIGSDGTLLRRFADTNDDQKVDLWAYFNFGVEVYRDIDADFNGKADQHRWLGTGGTRWGLDENEDGKIDRWQAISVEEVSSEVVNALRDGNTLRFARLLATGKELQSVGLGKQKTTSLATKASRAASGFRRLAEAQKAVGPNAKWVQFASSPPGIVPAGTDGSTKDVLVYENAVAMFEDGDDSGQLLVGTIIKIGDSWRLVDLPGVGDEGDALAQVAGSFFTPGSNSMNAQTETGSNQSQGLFVDLEKIDTQLASAKKASDIAVLHDRRADIVEKLIASSDAERRESWVRQLVDTVSVAAQSGAYPRGLARLKRVSGKYARGNEPLAAYADFQTIGTEYVTKQNEGAKFEKVQEWYLETLGEFIERYPKTREAAQAMLQLALSKEFEDKEREALRLYRRVASSFPNTDAGEKAAGAVRRLDSVGSRIDFAGSTINGKAFKLSALRGKPVVIHYWATWCEPCKQDMKLLRRLKDRYRGLELVGVNVDATRALATGFLNENKLPWIQLFEEGGLESSPLSKEFGVQTLPTMMLIDSSGKVVRHNIRAAELDAELAQLAKPAKK